MLEILLSSRETVWCHGNACIGPTAHFGIIVVLPNRNLHASGGVGRPNLSPLLAWSSAAGPSTLPQSHQISSCVLCQRPSCIYDLSQWRRKQHALLSHTNCTGRRRNLLFTSARTVCGDGYRRRDIILCTRIVG